MIRRMPAAVLSSDEAYRYFLSRSWNETGKIIAFIGLNPSTANATTDDPTIRRCMRFAKDWGGGSLWVVNLFAFRATCPQVMLGATDPIGPENDLWLDRVVSSADLVVAAWGNHGSLLNRSELVRGRYPGRLNALSVTARGMPGHPLYIRSDTLPRNF